MFLRRLCIKNYKSLKNVEFAPTNLSALVGPNAAGKSNFASAVDFLADVYRHGLEAAVAQKGGYENIAFRGARRSRSAVEFEATIEIGPFESLALVALHSIPESLKDEEAGVRLAHRFSFKAVNSGIEADFAIEDERLEVRVKREPGTCPEEWPVDVELRRSQKGRVLVEIPSRRPELRAFRHDLAAEVATVNRSRHGLGPQQLFGIVPSLGYVDQFSRRVAEGRVFHVVPSLARDAGVPTPNPVLSMTGQNLPAVVAWLKRQHKHEWLEVIETMREIVPGLDNIESDYLYTKTLGLFFKEKTASVPWTAADMSDGTIHALCLLVALADPRTTALVIEEVENAFHPWVVQTLMKRFRFASQRKTVVLTTHSPVVVDTLDLNETWVQIERRFHPDPERHELYQDYYRIYRDLYEHTVEDVHALARLGS